MSQTQTPQLVVITPVRNEAWVLEAWLTHVSSWADHIIIADHHSTDGSREIAAGFPKVTLIDNPCNEWVENVCRTALLAEASKIQGDKIIFALDADEFLSDGFENTEGWQRITHATGNIVFEFRWFNLYGDMQHGMVEGAYAEWVAHYNADVDIVEEYRQREFHAVHCVRVPCLEADRCRYETIDDIRFVHLGNLNRRRMRNKLDFYQVVNHDKNQHKSNPINLYRSYTDCVNFSLPASSKLPRPVQLTTLGGTDITHLLRSTDPGEHYIKEISNILAREGCRKFRWLFIWDNPDLRSAGITYQPPQPARLIYRYLKATQKHHQSLLIKAVDYLIKKVVISS